MLAPLASNWRRTVSPFRHRERIHPTGEIMSFQSEHLHPFAHDQVVTRVDGTVRLVFHIFT